MFSHISSIVIFIFFDKVIFSESYKCLPYFLLRDQVIDLYILFILGFTECHTLAFPVLTLTLADSHITILIKYSIIVSNLETHTPSDITHPSFNKLLSYFLLNDTL